MKPDRQSGYLERTDQSFHGLVRMTIDQANRLQLPAEYKDALSSRRFAIFAMRTDDTSSPVIYCVPEELLSGDTDPATLLRRNIICVAHKPLQPSKRLAIPPESGITSGIKSIIGMGEFFAVTNETNLTPEHLQKLALGKEIVDELIVKKSAFTTGLSGLAPVTMDEKGRFSIPKTLRWNTDKPNPFTKYVIFGTERSDVIYIFPRDLLKRDFRPEALTELGFFVIKDAALDDCGRLEISMDKDAPFKMPSGVKILNGMGSYIALASNLESAQHSKLNNEILEEILRSDIAKNVVAKEQSDGANDITDIQGLIRALICLALPKISKSPKNIEGKIDIRIKVKHGKKVVDVAIGITPNETIPARIDPEKEINEISLLIGGLIRTLLTQRQMRNSELNMNYGHCKIEAHVKVEDYTETASAPAPQPAVQSTPGTVGANADFSTL